MAIPGSKARVKVSGAPVSLLDEPTTADATLTVFQITDPLKRVLEREAAITVERSTDAGTTWTTAPESEYSLNRLDGQVTFAAAQRTDVVGEAIGSGDGVATVFYTAFAPVVADSQTIYVGGVAQTEGTDYTFDDATGTITFAVAPGSGVAVTGDYSYHPLVQVTGSYLPMAVAAACKEVTISFEATTANVADFDSEWAKRIQTLRDVTGSLGKWTTTDRYFERALLAADDVVIEFWTDRNAADPDFRIWAKLSSEELTAAVADAQETSVDFEGTTDLEGNAVHEF